MTDTATRPAPPRDAAPEAALAQMSDAAVLAVDIMKRLHDAGSSIVGEVLRDHGEFTEWEHYPPNDSYDSTSHAQFYFHAHPPDARDEPDFGHFHVFLRPKAMPPGIRPAPLADLAIPAGDNDALSHLVAISMTPEGLPERLFTTNRWVTGETWYTAPDVIAMLDRFSIENCDPAQPLHGWLTAMIVLFRPKIADLLLERDRIVAQWQSAHPRANTFEDRRLEVTSSVPIWLYDEIASLHRDMQES